MGWRRGWSARERKEVVVIVTESLYTCQSDLFQASCFYGGKKNLKRKKAFSLRENDQLVAMHDQINTISEISTLLSFVFRFQHLSLPAKKKRG